MATDKSKPEQQAAGHTEGPWTNGWGDGLTGPNTPALSGVTCGEFIAVTNWHEAIKNLEPKDWPAHPKPSDSHIPISIGEDTLAIVVGPNREANARIIVAAVNSYDKHCGPRAIELAEGDLLGEALAALKLAHDHLIFSESPLWEVVNALGTVLGKAEGIIPAAKLEGK